MGYLKSCNLDSPDLTLVPFMMQFLEQTQSFPSYLKYLYYDEPNPTVAGQWTDCGWGNLPNYTFYAMGNDERYVSWGNDPNVGLHNFLWKDEEPFPDIFTDDQLSIFGTDGVLWESYVYEDLVDGVEVSPGLLFSRMVSVRRGGNVTGVISADIDMDFLSSVLDSSLISPHSAAFIIDLAQKHIVIAHTFSENPLFTNSSTPGELVPFSAEQFPNPLMQAFLTVIVSSYGSLEQVPSTLSEFSWGTTPYLYSTMVSHRRGLHWLSCQLTPKQEFQGKVNSATDELVAVLAEGLASVNLTRNLEDDLGALSQTMEATVERTAEATSSVRATEVVFIGTAVCVLVVCSGLSVFVFFRMGRVVRELSREMARVAGMRLEGLQPSSCKLLELDHLRRGFTMMVKHLLNYKHFLPVGLFLEGDVRSSSAFTEIANFPGLLL